MKYVLIVIAMLVLVSAACESSGTSTFDCNYNTHKAGDAMGIAERIWCIK
jgi:hypothetical protein